MKPESNSGGTAGAKRQTRDPKRTKLRILEAALEEFAAKGFAGARVDAIARSAAINKRMLYHYFGGKEELFQEVVRRKMAQRRVWNLATPDDPVESLPYWFELAAKDRDWVRLLEWEALQFTGRKFIDETRRAKSATEAVGRIARKQKLGHLAGDVDAANLLLGMIALSWFPLAFPQLTRFITGYSSDNAEFLKGHQEFLRRVSAAFRGSSGQKAKGKTPNK
jgi:AcrR family transcriptional regulator